jgi:hypothetical protein
VLELKHARTAEGTFVVTDCTTQWYGGCMPVALVLAWGCHAPHSSTVRNRRAGGGTWRKRGCLGTAIGAWRQQTAISRRRAQGASQAKASRAHIAVRQLKWHRTASDSRCQLLPAAFNSSCPNRSLPVAQLLKRHSNRAA